MTSLHHGVQVPLGERFSPVIRESFARGTYESTELTVLRGLLREEDRVLELGAGCGFLAAWCALRIGSARVCTVEADPQMLGVLQATFRANGVSPQVIFAAASARGERRTLERAKDFWSTRTSVTRDGIASVAGARLDELLAQHLPTVLVVDIEGGERWLGPTALTGVRAVLLECHSRADRTAVDDWLLPQGFARSAERRRVRLYERTPWQPPITM